MTLLLTESILVKELENVAIKKAFINSLAFNIKYFMKDNYFLN